MKADRIYKFQIRQDLIDEDLNVPIIWIEPVFSCGKLLTNSRKETQMITAESGSLKEDYPDHGSHFLEHTPTLEVKESLPEGMDEMVTAEGYNTIISVTDPEHGWVDRKALAYSIDFQCYDESDPRMKAEQNPSAVLLSDWMRWWNDFDGDTWAYENAQELLARTTSILKEEKDFIFAHCNDCNSPVSVGDYSSCDDCGKDLCPACFTGNEDEIICSDCHKDNQEYLNKYSVNLLHLHDDEIKYDRYDTATEFAEEYRYDDNDACYSVQKIECKSESEYNGFMKALNSIDTGSDNVLIISDDEYKEILTVEEKYEENHA